MIFVAAKRKRAIASVTNALNSLVASYQYFGTIPTGAYFDPYLLGYISQVAAFFIMVDQKIAPNSRFFHDVLVRSFSYSLKLSGEELYTRSREYSESGDPNFVRGMEEARAVCLYTFGMIGDEDLNPLVQNAIADEPVYSRMSGGVENDPVTRVAGAMRRNTFDKRIAELQGQMSHA